jgi:sulfite reductase (NADPH) flavoprotein alpha-component
MFTADQQSLIQEITTKLSPEQQSWLGGYLTGLNIQPGTVSKELDTEPAAKATLTSGERIKILYGSRTGNSKSIASKALNYASSIGISADVADMNEYNVKELKKEKYLVFLVSTDGEGEPPVAAEELYEFINSERAPNLESLHYSVLGLGDSSYKHYCKIGKDFDQRLEQLGATRIFDRVDCDLDFEDASQEWYKQVLDKFQKNYGLNGASPVADHHTEHSNEVSRYDKKNPFSATILDKFILNGRGSEKEVMHLELAIDESGLEFKPGDSLGIISPNPEDLADSILEKSGISPESVVNINQEEKTIRVALIHDLEITCITRQVLEKYAKYLLGDKLDKVLEDEDGLDGFIYGRDFLDILGEFPSIISANELAGMLRKLPPRVYSISSSQQYNEDEIHLTVGVVRYNRGNRERLGACSTHLSDNRKVGEKVKIYIDQNEGFRLPEDSSIPIIMIGPGTGVAPFRSFLQEREQSEDPGKSWLFFGDRNFTTDFLYQTDFQKFKKKGILTKLDVAFSRDQSEKVYVQHKMMKKSREFYEWINQGAHIYVCGDKNRMARDVRESLLTIIEMEGGITRERAEDTLKDLRKSGRLQEDVY